MSKLTDIEKERLDVAEHHMDRLLREYKAKPRTGKDLEKLKLLEQAQQNLEMVRLL